MYIHAIELRNYRPLLHGGITAIKIDITSNALCVIGNNGSGKSSIIKELHPFPASAANYTAGGMKILHLTHNGLTYLLTSTMDGKTMRHSFVRGDEELNDSGKTTIQTELCEKEFGLTSIIETLSRGVLNICDMPVTQRKRVLMSCYPSDLTFLLNHHQTVASKLRAAKSNIKMLNERLISVQHELIPDGVYQGLRDRMLALNQHREHLLRGIAYYEAELAKVVGHPSYDPDQPTLDIEELNDHLRSYCETATRHYKQYPAIVTAPPRELIAINNTSLEHLKQQQTKLDTEIVGLVREIDRFNQLSLDMSEERIQQQLTIIDQLKANVASVSIDVTLPLLSVGIVEQMPLDQLLEFVLQIKGLEQPLLFPEELAELEQQQRIEIGVLTKTRTELEHTTTDIQQLTQRLSVTTTDRFRNGCVLSCIAREEIEHTRTTLQTQLASQQAQLVELEHAFMESSQRNEQLYDVVSTQRPLQGQLVQWLDRLQNFPVDWIAVLNGVSLREQFKQNPVLIHNMVTRMVENTRQHLQREDHLSQLHRETQMLETLLETKREKQNLLAQFSTDKITHLQELRNESAQLDERSIQHRNQVVAYSTVVAHHDRFSDLESYVESALTTEHINRAGKWLDNALRYVRGLLRQLEDERLDIHTKLKAQEALRIRIVEEIEPNLKTCREELDRLVILEQTLSPVTGIPHKYMVRFLNNMIKYTNAFIGKVWNYELEVSNLDVKQALDYDFPVKLFSQSRVPDLSMLSDGQKDITNLACTLALYKIRKLGANYPLKLDEVDRGLTEHHRTMLLHLLANMLHSNEVAQLILVNHHNSLFTGLPQAQIAVLNPDGIVLPQIYNENVCIERQ